MIGAVTAPIIFGQMHFLLISENEFFHEIKCNGMTSFMEFMTSVKCQLTTQPSIHNKIMMIYLASELAIILGFAIFLPNINAITRQVNHVIIANDS